MTTTNKGLDIIKTAESTVRGCTGEVRHGVVLETRRGGHRRIGTFEGIAPAFKVYKALAKV